MMLKTPFFVITACILLLSFFILVWVFPVDGAIDLYLIQPWVGTFGDFALKNNWYLAKLNHTYVKQLITAVYISFFALWILSFKVEKFKAKRWQYGYMFWVSMLCTCVIGLMKAHSSHACPWDMTQQTATGFVWDFSSTAGHCFPGGHASTGFALITGFFVYRLNQKHRAWFYLYASLILGFAMGWAQMMRGAHFISHNLWTGWICLAINFAVYILSYQYHLRFAKRNCFPPIPANVVK